MSYNDVTFASIDAPLSSTAEMMKALFVPSRGSVPVLRFCEQRRPRLYLKRHINSLPNRNYHSGDDRAKTTLEDVFGSREISKETVTAPWEFGWQMNERNVRWMDEFQESLIKRFAAEEMDIDDVAFEERLQLLAEILPGLRPKLSNMSPERIVELMRHVHKIPDTMLALKSIFPKADAASLVLSVPSLIEEDALEDVIAAAEELKTLLPRSDVDALVERYPVLLDVEQLRDFVQQVEMLMPGQDFEQLMQQNPSMIFSLQKGRNMIPYDEVPTSA